MALYQGSKLLAMGANGKSAYELAVAGGYAGTPEEFNQFLATAKDQVDGKSDIGHEHVIDNINGLQAALDEKANVEHSHDIADVNGLQDALNGKSDSDHTHSASDVGAEPAGSVSNHNLSELSHQDIRTLISDLTGRLNALADSDDVDLDQLKEIVAYIKDNRDLITEVTNGKVNVDDIVNNLESNETNKPLSAAQGAALKALIDAIVIPTKVSDLTNDLNFLKDEDIADWAKADTKPVYTYTEVGADAAGAAAAAETAANAYTDQKIAAIPTPDVSGQIGTHNSDINAHADIRTEISGIKTDLATKEVAGAAQAVQNNLNLHIADVANPHKVTASQVGADVAGTAETKVNAHNVDVNAHNDIRILVEDLTSRLNAVANSTDEDLDQLAEIVTYIKNNKTLIENITTGKISVDDIVNNLTTNVETKVLSAAQGVVLKTLIDDIANNYVKDADLADWAKAETKPVYTYEEVEADKAGSAAAALDVAKKYTDDSIAAIPTPDVSGQISVHNASETAHADIRTAIGNIEDDIADINVALGNKDDAGAAQAVQQGLDAHIADDNNPHHVTIEQIGAEPAGAVEAHNIQTDAHNDIRLLIETLDERLTSLADTDDTTLDQLSEIVKYIKNNKDLIDGITTDKVNVADIVDDLVTNVANKPLSAAQGVVLKGLINDIYVPTKLSEFENDGVFLKTTEISDWAKADTKPAYLYNEVGADEAGSAAKALADAKAYTDAQITERAPDVAGAIAAHNENGMAHADIRNMITETAENAQTALDAHIADTNNPHNVTIDQIGAEAVGVAAELVRMHGEDGETHADIRELIANLTTRFNALADSDDETLDQLSEIVDYVKNNKDLIDGITTGKVSVADIVNDLTSDAVNKPLSAAQGKELKRLIDAIVIPTKVSAFENDANYVKSEDLADWAKAETKPEYTYDEVGAAPEVHTHDFVVEQNKQGEQKFWSGTKEEFDAIEVKDDDTMYLVMGDSFGDTVVAASEIVYDGTQSGMESTNIQSAIDNLAAMLAARAPRFTNYTMLAANWVDNKYNFEAEYPSTNYNVSIQVAASASMEQFEAFGDAMVCGSAMNNIVVALNGAPTVDIPVVITITGK